METLSHEIVKQVVPVLESELNSIAAEHKILLSSIDPTEIEAWNKNKIQVPSSMNKLQGAMNLIREYRNEETIKDFNRNYPNRFFNDFVSTVNKIAKAEFGSIIMSPYCTAGLPADNIDLLLPLKYEGNNLINETAFFGSLVVSAWDNAILDINPTSISIQAKVKYTPEINAFLAKVERELTKQSIVQGQAVEISIRAIKGTIVAETKPVRVKINPGIFLEETVERIVGNLIIPSLNEGKKKAILFTGDFGTGKTETAVRVGVEGQRRFNRTFFYLKNASQFKILLPFLRNYQKSIVFTEDIDQVVDGERDEDLNEILNSIDGAELKGTDIVFLFTTNNHDKINPAMRRPGRIDEVIHFDYCDLTMVESIYKHQLAHLAGAEVIDWAEAARYTPEKLQGAIVSEIAQRTLKYAVQLHNGTVTTEVLKDSIASMKQHIDFMRKPQETDNTLETALSVVGKSLNRDNRDNYML